MNAAEMRKRLQAAQVLLMEPTTSREKFSAVRNLIQGINPAIDNALRRCDEHFSTWDKIESGDVIHLGAEHLPENTEEEKKRKKWVLLFINGWKDLKNEVTRVQGELSKLEQAETGAEKASVLGKVFGLAKGPLGIITILAVGAVVAMQATAVDIQIENRGCGTLYPSGALPSLPGFKLPSEPIPSGGTARATLPALPVYVDGTIPGALSLKILTYSLSFQLPSSVDDVTLNGMSLLNKKTEVKLSDQDTHRFALICS